MTYGRPVPVRVNGETIGFGFIDDSGQVHIQITDAGWNHVLTAGIIEELSIVDVEEV